MSSGTSIPYHLRPNKTVERGLFIHSLRKIANVYNVSEYQYIGFGGPFLEDFKSLHNELKISDMICLEIDENVRKRQQFNKPLSCIDFLKKACSSTDFINEHNFDKESIVWLDFVSFKDLNQQLADARRLVNNLAAGDIFKVTFNANSSNLGKSEGEELFAYRLRKFKELVTPEYEPHGMTDDSVSSKVFPNTLLQCFKRAVSSAMESAPDLEVVPISAFVYEDGQKMLTAMGAIVEKDKVQDFLDRSRIKSWPYYSVSWDEAINITLPSLSARERLLIEQQLPGGSYDEIRKSLGYYIGDKESDAEKQMKNFMSYYRSFPWFGKVTV